MLGKEITVSDETWEQIRNGLEWQSPEQIDKFIEDQQKEEVKEKAELADEMEQVRKRQVKYWKENPEREEFIRTQHYEIIHNLSDPYEIAKYPDEFLDILRKTWDAGQVQGMKQLMKLDSDLRDKLGRK